MRLHFKAGYSFMTNLIITITKRAIILLKSKIFCEKNDKDTCNHCNASLPSDRMCDNPFSKLKLLHINDNIGEQGMPFMASLSPCNMEPEIGRLFG